MSSERVVIRGEVFLTLEAVATCYRVDAAWVREVYELGLLGRGEVAGASISIAATKLDRVAEVLRLHFHHGVDLPGIAPLLGPDEELLGLDEELA